jgi:peptidoglycan/LPS O-acetylase OafA/YrhL
MKFENLTFYRFLAASIVVIFHFGRKTALAALAPGLLTAGPEMVSFFFVLSGFVMVVAYFERDFSSKKYFLARIARILPAYLLALAITIWISKVLQEPISKKALILNAFFLQSWFPPYPMSVNGPAWSLSVEAFFYAAFPAILLLLKQKTIKPTRFLLGAFLVWVFTQSILINLLNSQFYKPFPSISNDLIFYFPLSHFATFLLGAAGGYWYISLETPNKVHTIVWKIGVLASALAIFLSLSNEALPRKITGVLMPFAAGFFAPLFLAFILTSAFAYQVSKNPWKHWKPLILLGDASYAMYILQRPLNRVYNHYLATWLNITGEMHFYLFFALLILFSIAVLLLYECPIQAWIDIKHWR